MYLGTRRIRSAGRTSGSIEITLPTDLQVLEGVECHLIIRGGPRPEIVLQPDLSVTQALFEDLWEKLRSGFVEIGDIGEFSTADYSLALFPPRHWQFRPPLSYADALTVLLERSGSLDNGSEALSRLLAFLALGAVHRLGLTGALALAFGDALVYLITGVSTDLGTDFERGMACRAFWEEGSSGLTSPTHPLGSPFDDRVWHEARLGFRRVYQEFYAWQENPESYASAREKWYRALRVEIGMRVPLAEEHLKCVTS